MPSLDLAPLQKIVWQTAKDQGHHVNLATLDLRLQTLVRLALVHTEIAEAHASTTPAEVVEELADTAIRLLEMAWCCELPLTILQSMPLWWDVVACLRLHSLVATITQEVKRHGVTPAVGPLTERALVMCWGLAQGLGADMAEAIAAKDVTNRGRVWQYGTPGAQ